MSAAKTRTFHLGAFMRPVNIHTGAWRYRTAYPDANFNWGHLRDFARVLEQGCFDAIFLADSLAVLKMPMQALQRSATVTSFDPLTLLPALAAVTERIGLIATASTTYNEPYHLARKFASLDHLSGGRAGWNVVTSVNPNEALNFGMRSEVEHGQRYRRAREFYDVVTELWDSWADDAFVRDAKHGLYFDARRVREINHVGEHFSVAGPLNVARPLQGWPVIVQAGSSEEGRDFAATAAEVVFCSVLNLEEGRRFYADIHRRMRQFGRAANALKILPAAFVVIGHSDEEAKDKLHCLDALVHPDSGLASLSVALGHMDLKGVDLDGPLPNLPETNGSRGSQDKLVRLARERKMTVRQLCQLVGGSYGNLELVGSPRTIADRMEEWFLAEGCDGFNIMFSHVPGGLNDFVESVVPELQRRGLFRKHYEGKTLREHLSLNRPKNRHFD